ncbi:MAG: hypothetical protein R3C45_03815 [Phycisphaerales bacterium]
MRATSIRIGLAAAFAVGEVGPGSSASTLLADFNNHTIPAPGDIYGAWSAAR